MSDILAEYYSGQHEESCAKLSEIELTDDVPEIAVADEIAHVIVDRVRKNLDITSARLIDLGYQFHRGSPYMEATPADRQKLSKCEREWGAFPTLLRSLYSTFAWIDYGQDADQMEADGPLRGVGWYPHLVFLPLDECAEARARNDAACHADNLFMQKVFEERGQVYEARAPESLIITGACASNCDSKCFALPLNRFDGRFYDDGAGPITLHKDLRWIFRSGGMPHLRVWAHLKSLHDSYGPKDPDVLADRLSESLHAF